MDIDLIFKIAGTGIIVAVLNLVLKRAEREEQAMMTTLAGPYWLIRREQVWIRIPSICLRDTRSSFTFHAIRLP